ncbi:N-acetyl-gamma-glutamyl-phosphate reductase [Leptospira noguchii]|uniref:N-acetyl-gamma-glutamyl-phosphate reductase n=1 Tax=Leptospira noguchii TaxID=28182 RepID=UPI001146A5E3|nr:N-acetyl-gamma-glutamyl-phosphate reductase [Leptospira noguchii]TQE80815.1 N-acetyl-gamma-glutamyl-phosphate reductase [Leptospira noguchii]UOG32091.1 N-acetyl-gamma-glutamyl-phosphate reductase [Leptospira noguchii]UOG35694.1 N-acetyl-gamma-glutamyl-phosphate reductase [Leptospira noguchii]UOG46625.1 N-acetyl-gamma-glutamyl-phosphate reductase [Leptospira noguchii]UOG54314.1 N-acetyl-gamma-glutamyl-phosphate reductase [Leptospira noguchii]
MAEISILGAGGLTGKELLSLLSHQKEHEVVHITSDKLSGKTISEVFPEIPFPKNLIFKKHEDIVPQKSLVVLAVPNEVSVESAPKFLDAGHKVIDLSGVYRLHNQEILEKYYKLKHTHFDYIDRVVFGLPEIFRDRLKNADFVSNPGCFSTSVILPIFLLGELRKNLRPRIIVDSKSGVSGAGGRTEDSGYSYTSVYENFRAYKILSHQHEPEIKEYVYSKSGLHEPEVIFTPHLLPVYRGILSTIVLEFDSEPEQDPIAILENSSLNEPFIRILKTPEEIELKKVQHTNFLDISLRKRGNTLVVVSALDNLIKGAAGQALQNINLMTGAKETLGLLL